MSVEWDYGFSDANGTAVDSGGADASPTTGAKWVAAFSGSNFIFETNGAGLAVPRAGSAGGYAHSPTNTTTADGTFKFRFRAVSGGGRIMAVWRTAGAGADGYALEIAAAGTSLRFLNFGTNGTLGSAFGSVTANAFVDVWMRVDGQRFRVWLNSNTGTPDADFTESGNLFTAAAKIGLFSDSGAVEVDSISWDNVAASPGGGAVDEIIGSTNNADAIDGVNALTQRIYAAVLTTWNTPAPANVAVSVQGPASTDTSDALMASLVSLQPVAAQFAVDSSAPISDGGLSMSAAGAVVFTGSATTSALASLSASGAVVFTGAATMTSVRNATASGAVVFTGSATATSPRNLSASGAVVFTGSATANVGTAARNVSASGAVVFTGSANANARVNASASGAVKFTGTSTLAALAQLAASGAVKFTGSATGASPRNVSASGAVVFTGSASMSGNSRSMAASGVVVFTGTANASVRNGISAAGIVRFVSNQTLADEAGGTGTLTRRRRRRVL